MGASASLPQDKHVVVIGAGYGGITMGSALLKHIANFTLIDQKDSFCHNIAAPRAIVEPEVAKKMFIPLQQAFGDHFKQGKVTGIDTAGKKVSLESGDEVAYDVLVVAVGSNVHFPGKVSGTDSRDANIEKYREYAEKVKASQKIVVIGGGAVGIEIAADIATDYKDKEVTVVHGSQNLIGNQFAAKFQDKLKAILTRLNVKLVLGEKVTNLADLGDGAGTVTTDKGNNIEADLVIKAIGSKVNSAAYASGLGGSMEENGSLKVDNFFLVEGTEDVYAIGDCNNIPEGKLAFFASAHAELLVSNLAAKYTDRQMKAWIPGRGPLKVGLSLGRGSGIGESFTGMVLPEFLITNVKSKAMFIDRYWKMLKLAPPKD